MTPLPTLKRNLRIVFSEFIRLRDTDENGWGYCCDTGKKIHWKEANAGHFFSVKGNPALMFEENNVHLQSRMSNKMMRNSITYNYFLYMEKKVGREEMDRMAKLRGEPFKFTREWMESKITYYKEQVDKLKKSKNL